MLVDRSFADTGNIRQTVSKGIMVVNCPSDDALRAVLQNSATSSSAGTVAHLAKCEVCRQRIEDWGWQDRLTEILNRPQAPAGDEPRLKDRVRSQVPAAAPETVTFHPESLRLVGNYELVRRIGRGGGGEVYEAVQVRLRRRVAVKLLAARLIGDQHARERFFREMESIGRLNHPHIVQAHDAGEADGILYLAMELVDGPDVETVARRAAPLMIPDACEIIRQAALGLQHVHEHGMVHRDLKPSNLLLSSTGVKIADLGMALLESAEPADERLTGNFVIMGTGDYLAPEQTEGARNLDIRGDLYSLGCTLFRLLAGRPPFANLGNGTVMKKLLVHVQQPIPDICLDRPETPLELKSILEKLLAKRPDERYTNPSELAEALQPYCVDSNLAGLLASLSTESIDLPRAAKRLAISLSERPPTTSRMPVPADLVRLRSFSRREVFLAVGIIGLLATWIITNSRGITTNQVAQNSSSHVAIKPTSIDHQSPVKRDLKPNKRIVEPDVRPAPRGDAAVVLMPKNAGAAPDPIVKPGSISERWRQKFGMPPVDVDYPGRLGLGSMHFDENLRSLVITARQSMRLVKLGELKPNEQGFSLSADFMSESSQGGAGIFLGYRLDRLDVPRQSTFQVIQCERFAMPRKQRVRVQRYSITIKASNGQTMVDRAQYDEVFVAPELDTISLVIQVLDRKLHKVTVCGLPCPLLTNHDSDLNYTEVESEGDWGVFAKDATVWIGNPEFERGQGAISEKR